MKKYFTIAAFATATLLVNEGICADGLSNFYTKFEFGVAKPMAPKNKEYASDYNGGDYNMFSKAPKSNLSYGAGLGYQFSDSIRGDLTVTNFAKFQYQDRGETNGTSQDIKQNFSSTVSILNLYYTLDKTSKAIKPFFGFGVGVASNKAGEASTSVSQDPEPSKFPEQRKTSFAWNAQAGLDIKCTERINIDVFYKYVNLGQFSTQPLKASGTTPQFEPFATKLKVHNVGVALRLKY